MSTIIDSLIVTLGLDSKDFEAGQKKTQQAFDKTRKDADKTAKELEQAGKQAAEFFTKVRNEALAFFAVLAVGSGLKSFVTDTIASASSLDRMSSNLDMSAKDLAEWQLAAKHAGGSAEGMVSQLRQSADDVAKFKMGLGSDSLSWFYRMGGSTDQLKDGNTYLMARADIIKKIFDVDPNRAMVIARAMGISDDQFNLLKQGSAAVEAQRRAQAALADEMARASKPAEDLRKEMDAMGNEYRAVSVDVLNALLPSMKKLLDMAQQFGVWLTAHKDQITDFVDGAVKATTVAANAIGPLLRLIADGWKNIWSWIKAAGEAINKYLPQSWRDKIGEWTAKGLAYFGGKEAQLAVEKNEGPARSQGASAMFGRLEKQYGLPPGLLDSVWATESGRGTRMLSPAGAMGHFQFMPATAKQYGLKDPNNLAESADAAARMYRDLLKQNGGNLPMALAAYNWGQGNLQQQGFGRAPAETRDYIDRVTAGMRRANAMAAARLPNAAQALPAMRYGGHPNSTVSSETHIGSVTIQTAATDAAGIAKDFTQRVMQYSMAGESNSGIN